MPSGSVENISAAAESPPEERQHNYKRGRDRQQAFSGVGELLLWKNLPSCSGGS
jgi:hypothetical protein